MKSLKNLILGKNNIILLASCVLLIIIMTIISHSQNTQIETYEKQMQAGISKLFQVSSTNKNKVTDFICSEYMDKDFLSKMYEITQDIDNEQLKDKYRQDIYDKYKDIYKKMGDLGIEQFQIHLINGESFLCFQEPEVYGDQLSSIRNTINEADKTGEKVAAFEEGRYVNGYRYVYPLFYHQEHVATVEFSFQLKEVLKPIETIYSVQSIPVLRKSNIDAVSSDTALNDYKNSQYFDWGYLDLDFSDDLLASNMGVSHDVMQELNDRINQDLLRDETDPMEYVISKGRLVWVYPIGIRDMLGQEVADIFFYKDDYVLLGLVKARRVSEFIGMVLSLLLLSFIAIAINLWNKYKIQANYDALTKLYNRNYSTSLLKGFEDRGVVFMVDLDDFKKINDVYGHIFGDYVLAEMGEIFIENIRDTDVAVRWGGEEFMILLKGIELGEGNKKAKGLIDVVRKHDFDGVKVTISIGVCQVYDNLEKSIKCADDALLIAKSTGKDKVVSSPEVG